MKNLICLWWSSKPACAFCPFSYPFWDKSNMAHVLGCSIEEKKTTKGCWQAVFVNKTKHDLKNSFVWLICLKYFVCRFRPRSGCWASYRNTAAMHSIRHQENSAKSIAVMLLMCCSHPVRAWLSALCRVTACAPHPGGCIHLWGGLQKDDVPTDDIPMDPSQWELGGVGWASTGPHLCFPAGHWGQEGLRSTAELRQPRQSRHGIDSGERGSLALRGWTKPPQLWTFILSLLCQGIHLHRDFGREAGKDLRDCCGAGESCWCRWPLLPLCSSVSVFKALKWLTLDQVQLYLRDKDWCKP